MNTVYLGTSDFAAAVLERLAASPHRPALVVTRPDRPRGRGRRLASPPVADAARALGLLLAQPDDLHAPDSLEAIAAARPEVLCLCAYGALVKAPLLDRYTIFNVHPSLLPRWRGAAPVERAIMAGDAQTGVSIMRLTAGLDSGPVCLRAAEPIAPDDDYATLAVRLQVLGANLLLRALDERPAFVDQPETGVTYADKLGSEDRTLDAARPADELERTVRALRPHVGARVPLDDGFLGVWAARVAGGVGPLRREGATLRFGGLELLEVQPAGGRRMPAAEWLRGRAAAL